MSLWCLILGALGQIRPSWPDLRATVAQMQLRCASYPPSLYRRGVKRILVPTKGEAEAPARRSAAVMTPARDQPVCRVTVASRDVDSLGRRLGDW